jgi:hypothetical protein
MTEALEFGPVDYLVVEFPGSRLTGEGLPMLVDLVDRGIIRILDLVFIKKERDGTVIGRELVDVTAEALTDLRVFEGACSGLVGADDVHEAASVLEPGSSAALLIYENSWAAPFAGALRRADAQVVASGRIPLQDVLNAVDALEPDITSSSAQ